MNPKDRALLVVTEIEARGMELGYVDAEMVRGAVERNTIDDGDRRVLQYQIVEALKAKGYEVDHPPVANLDKIWWSVLALSYLIAFGLLAALVVWLI